VPPKIERPYDFIGWYGCTTSGKTRDGAQVKLLGDIRQQGGLGTGLIPLDNIVGKPTMARGISDFVDTISADARSRRQRDPARQDLRNGPRGVAGRAGRRGLGRRGSGPRFRYLRRVPGAADHHQGHHHLVDVAHARRHAGAPALQGKAPGTAEVLMTIWDAAVSNAGTFRTRTLPHHRALWLEGRDRAFGGDMQGQGAVFETPAESIKHTARPGPTSAYWPWLWALDFRHSGQESGGHPFAAVLLTWDRDNDVIYVMDAFRMFGMAANHVARIKESPMWRRAGGVAARRRHRRRGQTNDTIATVYKKGGLHAPDARDVSSVAATIRGRHYRHGGTPCRQKTAGGRASVRVVR
jgi:hypothetical protein